MRTFYLVKLSDGIFLFGLFFSGAISQSSRCFETAPVVECAGNIIKFFYDVEAKTCKFFKGSYCHDFRHGNYFDTFFQCKSSCLKGDEEEQESQDFNESRDLNDSRDYNDSNDYSESSDSSESRDNEHDNEIVIKGFNFDCSLRRVCMCPFGVEEHVQMSPLMCFPCMCKNKPPIPNCSLECPSGYVKNARGGIVCRCKESTNHCSTCRQFCRYGYLSDGNGCYNCECYIPSKV